MLLLFICIQWGLYHDEKTLEVFIFIDISLILLNTKWCIWSEEIPFRILKELERSEANKWKKIFHYNH